MMVLGCTEKINVLVVFKSGLRVGCPSGYTSTNSLPSFIWAMTQISLAGLD